MATCVMYVVLVLTVVSIATADEGFGYEDDTFDEKEFEYFYNMELLEKLELLTNNETEIDETILLQMAEDDLEYEDTTELDMILDKLLEEGDLIDEVLDEMEDEISAITMHEDESSMDLFNQILFYGFLISFIVMFIISSICTGIHFYKRVPSKTDLDSVENQKEIEFVFFPGRGTHSRTPQKGVVSAGIA